MTAFVGWARLSDSFTRWVDHRPIGEVEANVARLSEELAQLNTRQEALSLRQGLGQESADDPVALDWDIGRVGRELDRDRHRLSVLKAEREEQRVRREREARATAIEREHGITRPPSLTLSERRDVNHQAELAQLAAEPKPSKAELDARDVNGPHRKALKKAEADKLDLVLRGRRGETVDAIVAERNRR